MIEIRSNLKIARVAVAVTWVKEVSSLCKVPLILSEGFINHMLIWTISVEQHTLNSSITLFKGLYNNIYI